MNFLSKIHGSLTCFIDVIFPRRCFLCNEFSESEGLCQECWKTITWISSPKCKICGAPFEFEVDSICEDCSNNKPYFDKAISVFEYDACSKPLIVMFKHYDSTALAPYLAKVMYAASERDIKNCDVIIPVPITFSKRLKRKYSQSELLALRFSELSKIKYAPEILIKQKNTADQETLTARNRKKNLSGAFAVASDFKSEINGKDVVLIDDVMTTGSTVNECSKILKKSGAKRVIAVTAARVSKKQRT